MFGTAGSALYLNANLSFAVDLVSMGVIATLLYWYLFRLTNIEFHGGCNGNLKAISKLVNVWTVDKIEEILKGNTCARRPTSCADQLATAVREASNAVMEGAK